VSTLSSAGPSAPLIVDFADNRLLAALFGEHDRHLARIEQRLGVTLVPRGNRIAISGEASASRAARETLNDLYRRLESGQEVNVGEVDGVLRLVEARGAGAIEADGEAARRPASGPAADDLVVRTQKRIIRPRSATQVQYLEALRSHELVFGLGPAGTGKTYLAVAVGVSLLLEGQVDRLILTRPAVEAGERLGFLPGTMDEKVDPYMRPMYDALYDMMPGERVMKRRDDGEIEVAPVAYMRGRTLANAFIILDEAQNTTPMQMKMILTRMGENSRMVVTGDPSQTDLPLGTKSGLKDVLELLADIEGATVVEFTHADVVRHHLVTQLVRAYNARDRGLLDQGQ
jgi:phosphate starvation-inducible protein PhoH and related proteins